MSGSIRKIIHYTVSAACCGLTVFLGYYVDRSEFGWLLAAYALFFGLYIGLFLVQKDFSAAETKGYLALGVLLRVLLLFSLPNLSDDFYRFIWDGHLTVAGNHPFSHPPSYFIDHQIAVPGLTPALFAQLNSPDYFTVYPPVCQGIFALAVWLSPYSVWGAVVVMKLFLLASELGTLWLLRREPGGLNNKVLLYALNPLLILEIVGNCHFEGLMIFLLLAGWQQLQRNRLPAAATLWALATATKLLPPLFLPLGWRRLGWRRGFLFQVLFAGACLLLFWPLFDLQVLRNMSQSLELYFRRFEFNASLYYVAQAVGHWRTGYYYVTIVGPLMGLLTLAGTLLLAWRTPVSAPARWTLPAAMLWAIFLYLSCATTVHPWYATVPLLLGLLANWWFPLVWSGLIVLSYSHYAGGGSVENYGLIGLEYGLLWLFLLGEWWWRRRG